MKILIVDDDEDSCRLLNRFLTLLGHEVVSAENGEKAWELVKALEIRFVISDWIMPVMNGLDLCQRIRSADLPFYCYVMLLTAKGTKEDLVKGMSAGADDFLGKPFNREELSVRVRAGERVVGLEQKLQAQNATVEKAYAKLSQDLEAASNLQNSVLPAHDTTLGGVKFDWLFRPCHFVAGDHFNFFRINEFQTGFYLLDVVGHGVPAAMRSMTINHMLYPNYSCEEAEKLCHVATAPLSPSGVIRDLNLRFQDNLDTMFYFTIVYGIVDRARGRLSLTQAGHPSPIFIKRGGDASLLGKGGFPVGMLKDVEYDEISIDFTRGDRLLLYSDGVTECSNQDGLPFSTERLVGFLEESHQRPLKELMSDLERDLQAWRKDEPFEDDVSCLLMEAV